MHKLFFPTLGLAAITALAALPSPAPQATTSSAIYDDATASGWENWSWGTTLNFAATSPVKIGTHSIATTYTEGWSRLYFHHNGVPIADKKWLEFWVNGGSGNGGQTIVAYAEDTSGRAVVQVPINTYLEGGSVAAGVWRHAKIPLTDLALGTSPLTGLVFQNGTANPQSGFFLDQIELTGDGTTATPTPYATPPFGPTAPAHPQSNPVGTVPASLPSKFMIGLGNFEVDWIKNSGSKWQARYQYLVGGVNTNDNWTKWNDPPGQFATYYLNASAEAGVLPVFTYYEILQSEPRRYDETLPAYVEKFANAATMKAYYDDFKLLMDKCRAFDKPVIIHVEPDTWAYIQRTQSDPNNYGVQVAGSGHADAVNLPNTAVGFAKMLVRLRNRYAPKVLLALHASMWSTGTDVGMNRDPSLDIASHANATGTFLNQLSIGWDLIFVDFADRDAAYKQLVAGNPYTWWDETNAQLPSFHQAHHWLAKLNQKTGKRLVVWQVPVGNTKMRACDNTHGHYQDNRVQYYLGGAYGKTHIQELKKCGVVGLFFGRGDGNTTTYQDAEGDGITNPTPISASNTGVAAFSDDDGGFLRKRNRIYQGDPVRVK